MKSRGIGSRETSAARMIPSSLPTHRRRTPIAMQIGTRLGGSHQRSRAGRSATGNSAGHSRMPIEKIHEFGFVLRVLQLLIVIRNIYNLLLSFIKGLDRNFSSEQSEAFIPVHCQ